MMKIGLTNLGIFWIGLIMTIIFLIGLGTLIWVSFDWIKRFYKKHEKNI